MKPADVSNNNDDLTPLLSQSEGATEYGAIADAAEEEAEESRRRYEQRVKESLEKNGWWGYMKTYKILWQYIWPSKDRSLQFTIAAVAALTFLQRWTNILESLQTGRITDQLASGTGHFPWTAVLLYFLYHWLNSEGGISFLRSYLKLPVEQYSYRAITTAGFNHVLSLSSDFHTSKRTTDVYTAVTQARVVNFILDAILYRVFPIVMDAFVALGYFYITFGLYTALVVMIVSTAYLCVMIILGKRSAAIRRRWLKLYRKEANVMWEAMSCWETVIYFDRAAHEQSRFSDVLGSMLSLEWRYRMVSNLASVFEYLTLTAGLLFISFLAIHQIAMGKRKIGDYVTSVSFWSSITGSLQSVSNLHGHLWDMIINTERLLELLNTQPSVASKPGALDLVIGNGEIEFKDVSFAYDARKGAINGISFIAPGGKVTALVGESGGGKSTTLKLLFRFYDPTEGSINIDDQDIRDVTLSSLRNQIGVVPQEPKLFNDTIMNNLRYACLEATDEEIYSACQMAAIHDKILTFPDGYLSKCGEGGVKLSGGEKQRIAIARAILKNPKIVLLDEATSSVDIATECLIQGALQKLCAGRTTFVIAHRLSTIMNADQILVIGDGKITERGNHDDLMSLQGKYFELWTGPWNKRVDEVSMIKTSPLSENSQESEVPKQVDSQSPIAVVRYNTDEHKPKTSKTFTSPLSIKFVLLQPSQPSYTRRTTTLNFQCQPVSQTPVFWGSRKRRTLAH
ncbi:P-loop containing nucleoside triphosphate hydrolase protein [Kalaharituber pfeilii]|nr:P-loop containing nucleoside triphosphate hydrolase protein [Kalaharituber pfeilii]